MSFIYIFNYFIINENHYNNEDDDDDDNNNRIMNNFIVNNSFKFHASVFACLKKNIDKEQEKESYMRSYYCFIFFPF